MNTTIIFWLYNCIVLWHGFTVCLFVYKMLHLWGIKNIYSCFCGVDLMKSLKIIYRGQSLKHEFAFDLTPH